MRSAMSKALAQAMMVQMLLLSISETVGSRR